MRQNIRGSVDNGIALQLTTSQAMRPPVPLADLESPVDGANVFEQEDIPPDGGYGWVCTLCVFLINFNTWGVNSAWGIFLAHYLAESTYEGATHLHYALIGGLSISQALLISPLVTASSRRLGTRTTLLIGTVMVALSLGAASLATEIWHLFLSQGLCFGYGMGFLYIPATAILPRWFSTRRSLALGIATSGAGVGGLAYNLAVGKAVEAVGTAWTYRILALCTLLANGLCAVLLKDRKQTTTRAAARLFDWREYRSVQVLLVVFWGATTELGYITLLYSLPAYAASIGLSPAQGAVVGAVLNLGLALGRPIIGYASDSLGRINVATAMTALCGVFCLAIWVPAKTYPVLLLFALTGGTVTGVFWSCVAPVTVEVVGLGRLPSAFGIICLSMVLPTTFAEPIAMQLVQVGASGYLTCQVFVGCMFLAGAASTWALRSWKICEIEDKARVEREGPGVGRHGFWLTPRRLFLATRV